MPELLLFLVIICLIALFNFGWGWVWLKIQDLYANYKLRKIQNEKEDN